MAVRRQPDEQTPIPGLCSVNVQYFLRMMDTPGLGQVCPTHTWQKTKT